jgi:hypothetical protein
LSDGAASDLNWTSAAIVDSGSDFINVRFTAKEGDFHWVIYDDLAGAYQYFVKSLTGLTLPSTTGVGSSEMSTTTVCMATNLEAGISTQARTTIMEII